MSYGTLRLAPRYTMGHRGNRIEIRTNSHLLPPASLVWPSTIVHLAALNLLGDVLDAPLFEGTDWYAIRVGDCIITISSIVKVPESIPFSQRPPLALIAIGGPSGSGKTSVMREMENLRPGFLRRYVAFTTRQARANEQDGAEYHFRSFAEFERARQDPRYANFVEARGSWYWVSPGEIFNGVWSGRDHAHVFFISQRHDFKQRQRWFPSLRWLWLDASEDVVQTRLVKRGDTDIEESLAYNRRLSAESRDNLVAMWIDSDALRPTIINRLGCERVHVDIALGFGHPVILTSDSFGIQERNWFQSSIDMHVFSFVKSYDAPSLPLREGDLLIAHCFPGEQNLFLPTLRRVASDHGAHFGICVDLGTSIVDAKEIAQQCNLLMVLSIPIGGSGLPLDLRAIPFLVKARADIARKINCAIGIDGGVTEWSFGMLCPYVDIMVVGGLLFGAPDVERRWKDLLEMSARIPKTENGGVS